MDNNEGEKKVPWVWGSHKKSEEVEEEVDDGPSFSSVGDLMTFEDEIVRRRLEKYFEQKKEE